MRVDEISKAAAYNKPAPKGASAPERLLYLSLGILYTDFKKGVISKQEAAEKKTKIVSVCQGYEDTYNEWCSVFKSYQDNIKAARELIAKIEKSRDTLEIAELACEVVGVYTGDENFAKRQRKKWEK